ncbi:MAG: hypothetical protein N3I35_05720 [Clostridia bacterium]|nr:hypothetical protein [Clostridia bacterium]
MGSFIAFVALLIIAVAAVSLVKGTGRSQTGGSTGNIPVKNDNSVNDMLLYSSMYNNDSVCESSTEGVTSDNDCGSGEDCSCDSGCDSSCDCGGSCGTD